ncbi:MAG: hypothetical protein IT262_04645 [Saprospiraceae bacterium]|nr:hypothetical protein [Saprospiraceae bacterium]
MKTITFFSTLFFLSNLTSLHAQTTNVWKGGFPGHETEWNHHRNWSLGKTPDVFNRVIIPDVSTSTQKYPIVKEGVIEVQSLEIRSGASLTLLRPARIVVDEFVCEGTCKGCEWRVLVEGTEAISTALRQ